ncbi:MAG: ROK family protein [Clostridiales bacterium]|nr:ROK family protein [Roseburia sp.]MDD7636489.1 ROK family protein [Clostridiales bacterium]MDY4112175.1 ROK family protein [Roseburia sp.]
MRIAVIDIGGTCIKSGIWEDEEIKEIKETDTNAKLGGTHVMETVKGILREYHDFCAIGISTAGQVNTKEGTILYANDNIPGYTGTRIKGMLEEEFHVPVSVQNDVNSAAIGEAYYGAGRRHSDFLCLTYGTGVGGAIVINGAIYSGAGYSAGEFGAIVTHPKDRKPDEDMFSGCYERYASTTALVRCVKEVFPDIKNGRQIFEHLHDTKVRELVDAWIDEIVYGLVTLVHIFNPSLLVLGGGIMEQSYVIEEVRRKLKDQIMSSFRNVEILPAELGNTAGMLGAARTAIENYQKVSKS